MVTKHILRNIGESLVAKNNCPVEPTCKYGGKDRCTATKEVFEEKQINRQVESIIALLEHGQEQQIEANPAWPCSCPVNIERILEMLDEPEEEVEI